MNSPQKTQIDENDLMNDERMIRNNWMLWCVLLVRWMFVQWNVYASYIE